MKNRKMLLTLILVFIFLIFMGGTYAYFAAVLTGNDTAQLIKTTTGTLLLDFVDHDNNITLNHAYPGDTVSKTFKVENIGSLDTEYNIGWQQIHNEIISNELLINYECVSYSNYVSVGNGANVISGYCEEGSSLIGTTTNSVVASMVEIPAGYTHVYTATIEFIETDENQNYNQGKTFNGVLEIQPGKSVTNINGRLLASNGNPIINATMQTHSTPLTTTTDANGYYLFEGIEYGDHEIEIRDSSNVLISTDTFNLKETKTVSRVTNRKNVDWNDEDSTIRNMFIHTGNTNNLDYIELSDYIYTPEGCFSVSGDEIIDYYVHVDNDPSQPLCPRNIVLPPVIDGSQITKFNHIETNTNISSIIMTDGYTSVGEGTFMNVESLKKIVFSNTFNYMESSAFSGTSIHEVNFPNSLNFIPAEAFSMTKIEKVVIPSNITSIGDMAFATGEVKKVVLSDGLREIGVSAFGDNNIKEVVIPNSVTEIRDKAFQINKIEKVILPNNIDVIAEYVFKDNRFKEVTIPSSVNSIGQGAFTENEIEKVIISEGCTFISSEAFSHNNIKELSLPETLEYISESAFYDNKLETLTIPPLVTFIDYNAFDENNLKQVIIRNSNFDISPDSTVFGWASDITCVPNYEGNITNGCITWGAS